MPAQSAGFEALFATLDCATSLGHADEGNRIVPTTSTETVTNGGTLLYRYAGSCSGERDCISYSNGSIEDV